MVSPWLTALLPSTTLQGRQTFPTRGRLGNILGSAGRVISVAEDKHNCRGIRGAVTKHTASRRWIDWSLWKLRLVRDRISPWVKTSFHGFQMNYKEKDNFGRIPPRPSDKMFAWSPVGQADPTSLLRLVPTTTLWISCRSVYVESNRKGPIKLMPTVGLPTKRWACMLWNQQSLDRHRKARDYSRKKDAREMTIEGVKWLILLSENDDQRLKRSEISPFQPAKKLAFPSRLGPGKTQKTLGRGTGGVITHSPCSSESASVFFSQAPGPTGPLKEGQVSSVHILPCLLCSRGTLSGRSPDIL